MVQRRKKHGHGLPLHRTLAIDRPLIDEIVLLVLAANLSAAKNAAAARARGRHPSGNARVRLGSPPARARGW